MCHRRRWRFVGHRWTDRVQSPGAAIPTSLPSRLRSSCLRHCGPHPSRDGSRGHDRATPRATAVEGRAVGARRTIDQRERTRRVGSQRRLRLSGYRLTAVSTGSRYPSLTTHVPSLLSTGRSVSGLPTVRRYSNPDRGSRTFPPTAPIDGHSNRPSTSVSSRRRRCTWSRRRSYTSPRRSVSPTKSTTSALNRDRAVPASSRA